MTYPLEKEGTIITDEEKFHTSICGTCRFQSVCEAWEFESGMTLYKNHYRKNGVTELFVADDGTKGVFRCSSFEGEE